jgi:hypothetical protein
MATLSIIGWRQDDIRWSGWSGHARSELSKRLRSSLNFAPHARKDLERRIKARAPLQIPGVLPQHTESLRHILEALGAEVTVDLEIGP